MRQVTVMLFTLNLMAPSLSLAAGAALISGPNESAPDGLAQYGQFVGSWSCAPSALNPSGEWQELPARPTWVWHWVLNGAAIQDVWIPDPDQSPPGAAMGTNLRVYDPASDSWDMVWTTESLAGFQRFSARMVEGEIIMRGDIPAGQRPAHMARITFHDIERDRFEWKYDASAPGDGESWQTFSTLSCKRLNQARATTP